MKYDEKLGKFKSPKEKEQQARSKNRPQLTNAQKGLSSLGAVAGAAIALYQKGGFWKVIGFMILGNIAGLSIATLFTKNKTQK